MEKNFGTVALGTVLGLSRSLAFAGRWARPLLFVRYHTNLGARATARLDHQAEVLMKSGPLFGLMLALAAVVDCGHDTSNWDTASACNLVVSSLCESNANCSVETGETTAANRPAFVSSCLTTQNAMFNCSTVATTSGNPNECESDLVRTPCTKYMPDMGMPGTGLQQPGACSTLFKSTCEVVATSLCQSNANCSVATGETPAANSATFVNTCLTAAEGILGCTPATATTRSPSECQADLARLQCTDYKPGMGIVGNGLLEPDSCKMLFADPSAG
jgi:hypothetical protein